MWLILLHELEHLLYCAPLLGDLNFFMSAGIKRQSYIISVFIQKYVRLSSSARNVSSESEQPDQIKSSDCRNEQSNQKGTVADFTRQSEYHPKGCHGHVLTF